MDAWAEQTSLRLLEWMVATAPQASTALGQADSLLAPGSLDAQVVRQPCPASGLRQLASEDNYFGAWLRLRASSVPASADDHALSGDAARVDDYELLDDALTADLWLEWLASADSGGSAGLADENHSGDARQRLVRLVAATARLCLERRRAPRDANRQPDELSHADEITLAGDTARAIAYDMAYGLSHELNNPLANIASRARMLAEEETSERKRQLLSSIVDQAMRGGEMIADLMAVARPPMTEVASIDLPALLKDVVEKARPWASARGLTLTLELPDEPPLPAAARAVHSMALQPLVIGSDPAAVREALWALLRNALEAAAERIDVVLSLEPKDARAPAGAEPQSCEALAVVSILDDGAGLSEQARQHAFHPYFSGREAGRGLGLGLAKAQRIAREAGGYVTIDNLSAGGCAARIAWPCTAPSAE
jgi:signal transduction histidine kinase